MISDQLDGYKRNTESYTIWSIFSALTIMSVWLLCLLCFACAWVSDATVDKFLFNLYCRDVNVIRTQALGQMNDTKITICRDNGHGHAWLVYDEQYTRVLRTRIWSEINAENLITISFTWKPLWSVSDVRTVLLWRLDSPNRPTDITFECKMQSIVASQHHHMIMKILSISFSLSLSTTPFEKCGFRMANTCSNRHRYSILRRTLCDVNFLKTHCP